METNRWIILTCKSCTGGLEVFLFVFVLTELKLVDSEMMKHWGSGEANHWHLWMFPQKHVERRVVTQKHRRASSVRNKDGQAETGALNFWPAEKRWCEGTESADRNWPAYEGTVEEIFIVYRWLCRPTIPFALEKCTVRYHWWWNYKSHLITCEDQLNLKCLNHRTTCQLVENTFSHFVSSFQLSSSAIIRSTC